jgi:single-stranded-DNA-specific exonuclease
MQWNILSSIIPQDLDQLRQVLLENRDIKTEKEQHDFFHPKPPAEYSLQEVGIDQKQMEKALARLRRARDNQEDVLIFGDYDCDGICSTAILWEGLRAFGIVARPFIPDREKHGYGLSMRSLEAVLAEKKPDLLITVDNGIVAHAAFAELKKLGIDAILTDHHQPEVEEGKSVTAESAGLDGSTGLANPEDSAKKIKYPEALAVIHSTQLCGATVAWFFSRELDHDAAMHALDLAALATVSDQMPLLGVNRSFVTYGVATIQDTSRVGLQLLIAKAGLRDKPIDVGTINFAIAPRINAMGRIKHGLNALRLLCTKNMVRADSLVQELNETNVSRQELTSEMIAHARTQAAQWQDEHLIIVASTEYHEGVIGLIAGRLAEEFHKPAIAISIGEKVAKASARSIRGVNIIDLIRLVKDDLLEAGGHPMAAGFGLLPEKLPQVEQSLLALARQQIPLELLVPSIDVECILPSHLLNLETYQMIQEFAPFGQMNREPIFGVERTMIKNIQTMGKENQHLKLILASTMEDETESDLAKITGVGWRMAPLASGLTEGSLISLTTTLQANEWKGRVTLQFGIKSLR